MYRQQKREDRRAYAMQAQVVIKATLSLLVIVMYLILEAINYYYYFFWQQFCL